MIDEQSSKLYPIKWGVPQRSTLGPLLFILYINDLCNCTLVKPHLFGDDTCLVHSADTIDNLSKLINQDMVNVSNWMQEDMLCINSEKSNLLIIPHKFNSPPTSPEINIFYDGSPITISSDEHDKPFCTKAITIIDNFKNALGDTDNRQISIS